MYAPSYQKMAASLGSHQLSLW